MSFTSMVNGIPISAPASVSIRYGKSMSNMSACQRNPARASKREVSPLGVQRGLSQPSGGVPAVAASTSRQRTMSAHSASGLR